MSLEEILNKSKVSKDQFKKRMKEWKMENYLRISDLDFAYEDIEDAELILFDKRKLEEWCKGFAKVLGLVNKK